MTPRIAAIVQARMSSTRLPGKSLMQIAGAPLVWHVIHRLQRSRHIQQIVLATSTNPADDPLAAWAHGYGITCIRGPEDDVLGRFALASEAAGHPDIIVRVNADAPLIDADFIDGMIDAMIAADADFVTLKPGASIAHDGVDPFSRRALELMMRDARHDPVAREHVTGWLKQNQQRIRVATIDAPAALGFEGARLSVDTRDDVRFVETLYERLKADSGEISLPAVVELLRAEPELLAINGHVRQKTPMSTSGVVLFRCDGGAELGLGHIKRCLSLARALQDRQGLGVAFAAQGDAQALGLIDAAGFRRVTRAEGEHERDWIARILDELRADALVLDVRTDLFRKDVDSLRSHVPHIIALDDGSERRHGATLAIYPPVPQTRRLDWNESGTDLFIGWAWSIMGGEVWRQPKLIETASDRLKVLVAMGGSDPQNLTERAARALSFVLPKVQAVIAIGPAVRFPEKVADDCQAAMPDADIRFAPDSLMPIMAECDIALIAFGVTAYECAHVGVPAIYLGLTADHVLSAQAFENSGFGVNLGLGNGMNDRRITDAVQALATDPEKRRVMADTARTAIDGRGGERIAAEIAQRIAAHRRLVSATAG